MLLDEATNKTITDYCTCQCHKYNLRHHCLQLNYLHCFKVLHDQFCCWVFRKLKKIKNIYFRPDTWSLLGPNVNSNNNNNNKHFHVLLGSTKFTENLPTTWFWLDFATTQYGRHHCFWESSMSPHTDSVSPQCTFNPWRVIATQPKHKLFLLIPFLCSGKGHMIRSLEWVELAFLLFVSYTRWRCSGLLLYVGSCVM